MKSDLPRRARPWHSSNQTSAMDPKSVYLRPHLVAAYNTAMAVELPENATCLREGTRFDLYRVDVNGSDGKSHAREFIHTPGSVVILPMLDADTVVLIRNRRAALGQCLWELPAGTLEPNEDPAVSAARELIEETGFEAATITKLTAFFPSPGVSNEFMHAYRADGLTEVGQDLDDTEDITVHPVKTAEALAMVQRGEIADAKSVAVLLFDQVFNAQKIKGVRA